MEKKRFVGRYFPVYLHCIFCLLMVCDTLCGVTSQALGPRGIGHFYDVFLNANYVDGGAGFARRWFWNTLSGIPLAAYVLFCRTVPRRASAAWGLGCLALSLAPPALYMAVNSGSVFAYMAHTHWMNYLSAILTVLGYLYIWGDFALRRLVELARQRNGERRTK